MLIIKHAKDKPTLYGVYDTELDTWLLEPKYKSIFGYDAWLDSHIVRMSDDLYGIIKSDGTWLIDPIYNSIRRDYYYDYFSKFFELIYKDKLYKSLIIKNNRFYQRKLNKNIIV